MSLLIDFDEITIKHEHRVPPLVIDEGVNHHMKVEEQMAGLTL